MNNLKTLMNQKGIIQSDLAKRVGVSEVTVCRYVKGVRNPKMEIALKIANVLDCKVDDLFVLESNEDEKQYNKFMNTLNNTDNTIEDYRLNNLDFYTISRFKTYIDGFMHDLKTTEMSDDSRQKLIMYMIKQLGEVIGS